MGTFTKDKIYDGASGKKEAKIRHIVVLIILAVILGITIWGYKHTQTYLAYKDVVVSVDARVSDIREVDDGDGGTDYKYWISYEYNDEKLNNREWRRFGSKKYEIGDAVSVKIAPNDPGYIFRGDSGVFFYIVAFVLLLSAICIVTGTMHDVSVDDEDESIPITEEMLADDVKPEFLILLTKCLLGGGFFLVVGHMLMPAVFSSVYMIVGGIFAAMGIGFLIAAVWGIKNIPQKKYSITTDTCTNQWTEGSGEDAESYTMFHSYGKIRGTYGRIGHKYYMVKDKRGKMLQLYDVEFWKLEFAHSPLEYGSRVVYKNFWIDLLLEGVLLAAYIGIIYALLYML